ncbi:TetR/AcrR family transcriptional regulator [Sphaerisporangium sp. TRM90804]|uniref:TetR/AcrR family transcriptional regulator n=1 Tax=Sphaerisporangium sp. TRM90804 TaxID=3031113 RepID=UPI002447ADB9|nr:TetR/AcrR family transcriptional regulator [Sphaerisporangium sp. TRM90804]MDH2427722.1 TetR/AcrR family transcriptional regulator [Sphaerisporangium sp. TRM90804]
MPRRPSGTRERIQAAALELFGAQGIQQTSLREIADRLGITKPALYYHFASREDLVRSLVQPLIDQVEELLAEQESAGRVDPRRLLERYFDLYYQQREVTLLVVRELSALAYLDLASRTAGWRQRLVTLLVGPAPALADQARAVVAVGGLADCTVMFAHLPADELRPAAVDAACGALGIPG